MPAIVEECDFTDVLQETEARRPVHNLVRDNIKMEIVWIRKGKD